MERSTIGLMNRQKQKQQQKISVPKKLLDTVAVKLGLGERCLIANGCPVAVSGVGQESADSNPTVELDASNILDLFINLFGSTGGNKQPRGSSSPRGGAVAGRGGPEFGRVYSLDSDSSSLGSSPDQRNFIRQSSNASDVSQLSGIGGGGGGGASGGHTSNTATSKSLFHTPSSTSGRSGAYSLPSDDGTLSVHGKRSNSEQQDQEEAQAGRTSNSSNSPDEKRDRGDTISSTMEMEDDEDRQDSYDSTISLDTSKSQGGRVTLPAPPQQQKAQRVAAHPLMLKNTEGAEDCASPPSPGQGAAAHLAEALNKLRQVTYLKPTYLQNLLNLLLLS